MSSSVIIVQTNFKMNYQNTVFLVLILRFLAFRIIPPIDACATTAGGGGSRTLVIRAVL